MKVLGKRYRKEAKNIAQLILSKERELMEDEVIVKNTVIKLECTPRADPS